MSSRKAPIEKLNYWDILCSCKCYVLTNDNTLRFVGANDSYLSDSKRNKQNSCSIGTKPDIFIAFSSVFL